MNQIIFNQEGTAFYNSDKILSVSEDCGGISIKTDNASIPIGRYNDDRMRKKALELLEGHLSGRFHIPQEKALEYIFDTVIIFPHCQSENKITYKTLNKLVRSIPQGGSVSFNPFYCTVCGNKIDVK